MDPMLANNCVSRGFEGRGVIVVDAGDLRARKAADSGVVILASSASSVNKEQRAFWWWSRGYLISSGGKDMIDELVRLVRLVSS